MLKPILWAGILGLGSFATALDPVEAVGNKFFNNDGSQFFLKGVAYQLVPDDPLIDTEQCTRDFSLMKTLGVNTIRVYHVDANGKHDGCMKALEDAGIYLLVDLDTFDTYIEAKENSWNVTKFNRYTQVMDAFQVYDNVLGFFLGNENVAKKEDSPAAPFLKAAAHDLKLYRDNKGYRNIPIGYSAADIVQLRPMLQDYLTCGGNSSDIVDFFALNSYSWCDPSTFQESSYDKLQEYAQDFPVPIFFSETGCNVPGPRRWDDQDAIFSDPMVHDWSGAIIYEWIQEQNNYGLISYGPKMDASQQADNVIDGYSRKGTPTPISPDFDNLKTKWASIHPSGVSKKDYDPQSVSTRPCPVSTAGGWWQVDGNVKLPTIADVVTATSSISATTESSKPSKSSEPSQSPDVTAGGNSDKGSPENKGADGSMASTDRHIAVVGACIAAMMLGLTLVL